MTKVYPPTVTIMGYESSFRHVHDEHGQLVAIEVCDGATVVRHDDRPLSFAIIDRRAASAEAK